MRSKRWHLSKEFAKLTQVSGSFHWVRLTLNFLHFTSVLKLEQIEIEAHSCQNGKILDSLLASKSCDPDS